MSKSVIPRLEGDQYQALIFWEAGTKMLRSKFGIEKVVWESSTHPGFDDVEIHYSSPGKRVGERFYKTDFLQVKHHASHAKAFTCEALMDPEFIGTANSSILTRLHDAYKKDPDVGNHSRLIIINTWGMDPKNPLGSLVGKEGAVKLDMLFDGSGAKSKLGIVRKAWRDHLKIESDEELKKILTPLRIRAASADLDYMAGILSDQLELAKLQPLSPEQRSLGGLVEIIHRLYAGGRNEFTKDDLQKICEEEGIILKEVIKENMHVIGVRSFYKGAQELHLEVDDMLCLLDKFIGRFLHETASWSEVYAEIEKTAQKAIDVNKPVKLHLDTHLSVAFALGYGLNSKSGVATTVVQKTANKKLLWSVDLDTLAQQPADNWTFDTHQFEDGGNDLAICVSATHNIVNDVLQFEQSQPAPPAKMLSAVVKPQPSGAVFKSGNHIYVAVQELVARIRKEKQSLKPGVPIRLYISGPVAFAFFFGQLAGSLGKITLYEFDFEQLRDGTYLPTISLPIVNN